MKQCRQDMQSDEPEQHPSRNRMDLVKKHSERLVAGHYLWHLPCKEHEVAPARQTLGRPVSGWNNKRAYRPYSLVFASRCWTFSMFSGNGGR